MEDRGNSRMGIGKKVGFISLGCPKNLVDTEIMLGLLKQQGWSIVNRAEEADIVVINTCGFITPAKEEAIDTILEMARLKENGRPQYLVATGCLAQRYGKELLKEIPELDAVVGVSGFTQIASVLRRVQAGERFSLVGEIPSFFIEKGPRVLTTPRGWAYLKVADGCDNRCTYCTIPSIRGGFRSRPVMELVEEARWLAYQGVRELVLVAQDTTMYGQDLFGEMALPGLLKELSRIDNIEWIRIMYGHPAHISPDLVEVMATEPKVVPYLDIPVQHASDRILRKMGRKYRVEDLLRLVENLRREIPGLVLRTTVMVGFPGETREDFADMVAFINQARFDWLGGFTYCEEEGTPAASLSPKIEEGTKKARLNEILRQQKAITFECNRSRVGRIEKVLVSSCGPGACWGRGYYQAPEVDGITLIKPAESMEPGQMVKVRLVEADGYDLVGEVTGAL